MQQWARVQHFLVDEATRDLNDHGDIRPCLVAFTGVRPLFVAFLRSFAPGEHAEALIELLALAAPLGADRLALSLGGRAWSLADPIPPVLDDGDLRQRVLCTTQADGAGGVISVTSRVHPFTLAGGCVTWLETIETDGGEGWTLSALRLAVEHRASMTATADDICRQARRCAHLGHLLGLDPTVALGLGLSDCVCDNRLCSYEDMRCVSPR